MVAALRRVRYLCERLRQRREHVERIIPDHQNPFEVYSPQEVRVRYRFFPDTIMFIARAIGADLQRLTDKSSAIPVVIQLCVALRFFATGSFFIIVGDCVRLSKSAAYRAVLAVLSHRIQFSRGDAARRTNEGIFAIVGNIIIVNYFHRIMSNIVQILTSS